MPDNTMQKDQDGEKLLSGFIPIEIYWAFKKAAAERQEQMKEALLHAALLYIDAVPSSNVKEGQK